MPLPVIRDDANRRNLWPYSVHYSTARSGTIDLRLPQGYASLRDARKDARTKSEDPTVFCAWITEKHDCGADQSSRTTRHRGAYYNGWLEEGSDEGRFRGKKPPLDT